MEPPVIDLVFDFMENEFTIWAMIQYNCEKSLSMYKLLNQMELVNWKVPSGIIYTHDNLLHLDTGLF